MKERLLEVLACPEDGLPLTLRDPSFVDEVKTGRLVCEGAHEYPVVNYIPRFVPSDLYVGNFSKEWIIHRTTQYDSVSGIENSRQAFELKTGFTDDEIRGKLVLEGGCGSGRFLAIARRADSEVVGLDLSHSVDAAFQVVGKDPKTHLVQGDILRPPFKPESFDYVYSIGVLHHTRDAKEGFFALRNLLRKGGRIAIWLYPNDGVFVKTMNAVGGIYRRGASAMSLDALYHLCVRVETVAPIPRVLIESGEFKPDETLSNGRFHPRQAFYLAFPFFGLGPSLEWRILDTFDYLSPRYQTKHTWAEVRGWFRQAGLVDLTRLPIAVSWSGRRP